MEPSSFRIHSRSTLHHRFLRRKNSRENLGRFIPNRAAMDLSYAHYMVTEGTKRGKENPTWSDGAYQNLLADTFNMNRRIFYSKNKPPVLEDPIPQYLLPSSLLSTSTIRSRPRHIPKSSERKLDCPDLVDDVYLNLLDWHNNNVVAVALEETVCLWNASDGTISELLTVSSEDGPVTSVNWAPDGRRIAVGLDNSDVQIWDCYATRLLRKLSSGHQLRVNSLAWNNHILTSGGEDSKIINNDVRARDYIVERYRGHHQQVRGLKWSNSGRQLASGGNDNLVFIWDKLMASSNSPTQWLQRLEEHTDTVKALAWCPFQANLLSSGGGGGEDDRCIKFWNTQTGACLNSVDTGSQVCALLWNKHKCELLGAHGFPQNQLSLWKYPSMVKMAELNGHTSRVLFMSQSPDGYQVATAAAAQDETLQIWNMFGIPEVA